MLQRLVLLLLFAGVTGLLPLRSADAQHYANATGKNMLGSSMAACNPQQFAKMKQELADWPDLARYQKADAKLPAPTPGQPRVVFMGDSITDIWGRLPWTGKFFPGKPYINRGISGQTTPQMLLRFRQDVIDLHSAAVLILAGTNDLAGNTGLESNTTIENNYRSMAELAQIHHIRVIFASITPAAAYPWHKGIDPVARIRVLNQWLRAYCATHHFVYVDYYDAMALPDGAMKPGISIDGVHPNAKGFAIMTPLAEEGIAEALGQNN